MSDPLLPAAPFAPMVRRAWRTYTYGEMAAITGVSPTTLHAVMHGDREFLRVRTAVKLKALQEVLPSTTDP